MDNIKFKKKFGQNFIYDTNLLKAIVNDGEITDSDDVLEIGVGAGTLTREICQKANKVISYEIDTDLMPTITQNLINETNSQIVYKDFLKEDSENIKNHFPNGFKVVANLPYYITTPIIFKLLDECENLKSITIMVQKEVAERICAKENTQDYGILTIMINSVADTKIKRIVKRNMFIPMPNVDSAICHININRQKFNIINMSTFKKVVNSAFNHRRKMLISNLATDLNVNKSCLENIFSECDIDTKVRGEALSINQFVNLSNKIFEICFSKGEI
ncbi:MAG: ribosomal RNA small subunit methyltransferase A [Clostridia bacterium]|nr:ribosomal RNA small subunit methyltransferase A [Clostridia bacterium]